MTRLGIGFKGPVRLFFADGRIIDVPEHPVRTFIPPTIYCEMLGGIRQAKAACAKSGHPVSDLFVDITEMVGMQTGEKPCRGEMSQFQD